MSSTALTATGVGIQYYLRLARRRNGRELVNHLLRAGRARAETFWAVRDVTFSLMRGEVLGVIGRNGSGKSTLLMALAGILRPDAGEVRTFGRVTLLTLGAGFDPDLTGRQNVYLNAALLGLSKQQTNECMQDIIDFAELGEFIDVSIRQYSSGMRSRLGFSIAARIEPDILMLDEMLGVGDAGFQDKSRAKMRELMSDAKALVIVAHSTSLITEICTRVLWLHEGIPIALGDPAEVSARYDSFVRAQRLPVRSISSTTTG